MIRMSLIFSLLLFTPVVSGQHPCGSGVGAFHGGFGATNRCGAYGCVNGRPAVVIPGYPNGGPYPPTTTRIIIERK